MSIKINFYASINDKRNEEKVLKKYEEVEKGEYIYQIEAREICSEFISRYFNKVENGIYKAKINKMIEDTQGNFEFKAYKECKKVRENLLEKYQQIGYKIAENENKSNISIYALLDVGQSA